MAFFQVTLLGENFFVRCENETRRLGFYTTRWVKADSEKEAESKAVALVRNDKHIRDLLEESPEPIPEPMIYLENINSVSWVNYVYQKPGAGYTFFPMDSE